MSDVEALMKADTKRRVAMVAGDVVALGDYLAEDLSWTHSSGKTDSKESFLAVMASGSTVYHSLDVRDTKVRIFGDIFVLEGVVFGDVTKDGLDKKLVNRFITVWQQREHDVFQLQAWQSTGLA
ncbi:MAG: nuclear transport factor 2 family protein [Gammaproteobacteria bacterium]|jgi:ketosteroid isomerase-like protein|nr:nuclear transport factor 2 family protein [Gammaproteobacteria bacterium]MDG1232055.1 nuclear transport factor 2 family protein [Pseudomonadales bacterium]MBT5152936.1 nuclear transport factor 2 family protein [Gammaproteobacteria bacterium]MBT5685629.1 nuclear transport factor 2 family protein [Gammaproteobacteria bacterium]MBT5722558.1 nuclear transport factor 2 family protein [Gammaproteobacteria bacterium]